MPVVSMGSFMEGTSSDARRPCRRLIGEYSGVSVETPALAYPEGGRTKTLTLTGVDVREVKAALARYQKAKAELDRTADAGVAALRAWAAARPRRQP